MRICIRSLSLLLILQLAALVGCRDSKPPTVPSVAEGTPVQNTSPGAPPAAQVRFDDVATPAGVQFTYRNGEESGHYAILESLGGGLGAIDFDCDGLDDLCVAGGGQFPEGKNIAGLPLGLFRNLGNWEFAEATTLARANDSKFYSHGICCGDYNSDGLPDVLVTGYGGVCLFENEGDGTFQEQSRSAELTDSQWSSSAGWGDLNGDGLLDLFIVHYVNWSFENDPFCPGPQPNIRDVCPPRRFQGLQDTVYFNNGDGTFKDVTQTVGVLPEGKGLGLVIADLDNDHDLDVYVTNDTVANHLYRNDGQGTFKDMSLMSGTSVSDRGIPDGSMGVELFDYNRDGLLDLWVVNYENESASLYHNEGDMFFRHVSQTTGVTAVGGLFVGWGTCCFDYDHDGDEDMFVSNGHVIRYPTNAPLRQNPLLFENLGNSRFRNVANTTTGYLNEPHSGRGAVNADFDRDGLVDLAVSNVNEPVAVLANRGTNGNNWIALRLVGTKSSRDPIGATVTVRTAKGTQTRQMIGAGSYASTETAWINIGLGEESDLEAVEISWPSGVKQSLDKITINSFQTVVEPLN